jgi:hypothetical protein
MAVLQRFDEAIQLACINLATQRPLWMETGLILFPKVVFGKQGKQLS